MEITKNSTGDLTGTLIVKIGQDDYKKEVENTLRKLRQKAQIKGFRPGKAPMGLIKKFHEKQVIVEEVNELLGHKLDNYIKDEKLKIFGDLLPSQTEETSFDPQNSTDFTFAFDYGLFPNVEVDLEKLKLTSYNITVADAEIDKEVEHFKKQNGNFIEQEAATEESQLELSLVETEKSEEDRLNTFGKILVSMIQDEEIKKQFLGLKKDDKLTFDIKKAFTNEADLAGLLGVDKERLAELSSNFEAEVKKVEEYKPAEELTQEVFDKAFGEGVIKSEEDLRNNFKEQLEKAYKSYSDNRFVQDAREKLMKEVEADFPDEFLVRWQLSTQKGEEKQKTEEEIKEELPKFKEELKWHVIKSQILDDSELKIEREDLIEANKKLTLNQFMQYGLPTNQLNDELITKIATESLDKLEGNQQHYVTEIAIEDKVFAHIKTKATLESKDISMDDFQGLDTKIKTEKLDLQD